MNRQQKERLLDALENKTYEAGWGRGWPKNEDGPFCIVYQLIGRPAEFDATGRIVPSGVDHMLKLFGLDGGYTAGMYQLNDVSIDYYDAKQVIRKYIEMIPES